MPTFEACGVRVAEDPVKGKVVLSERQFDAGDIIFSEEAFVFAPWSTDVCDGCEEPRTNDSNTSCSCTRTGAPKPMYSRLLQEDTEKRAEVVELLASFDGISEVDRARTILKSLAMYERDPSALDDVLQLSYANYDLAMEITTELRAQVPEIFPSGFTNEQMATLIAVLNTNSHELENLGGSGLFLSACRMEHNCMPNCSFTTYDSALWMTAIKPIARGDALSIDYGNFFYRPTPERMSSLLESYGFVCSCDACLVLPDTCRSFQCKASNCTNGAVWPYPKRPTKSLQDPEDLTFEWRCRQCHRVSSEAEVEAYIAAEQDLLDNGFPESLDQVDAVVKRGVLHERHYLLFWALDAIGCEAAALTSVQTAVTDRQRLATIWERIITYMNIVVPAAHHEKTIYYDNLAQVHVILGNQQRAIDAYRRAYEISCLVSGKTSLPTQKLRELMERPPQTAQELREIYARDAQHRRRTATIEADEGMSDEEDDTHMDETA